MQRITGARGNGDRLRPAIALLDGAQSQARAELESLVRIPSISADPDRRDDVRASAQATAELLAAHGLESVRLAGVDGSHPYVIGEWMHAARGAPTVLLYAHHDVQPPGIVDNWDSDPFEPCERDGRLYGRGSADDKAGGVAHAHAVSAWLNTSGAVPCNVRVLIEGEEEIGGASISKFVAENPAKLKADVALVSDTQLYAEGLPTLCIGLRGLVYMEVEATGPDRDLHSGLYGGAAPNPA